jgi:hypothetical protein
MRRPSDADSQAWCNVLPWTGPHSVWECGAGVFPFAQRHLFVGRKNRHECTTRRGGLTETEVEPLLGGWTNVAVFGGDYAGTASFPYPYGTELWTLFPTARFLAQYILSVTQLVSTAAAKTAFAVMAARVQACWVGEMAVS